MRNVEKNIWEPSEGFKYISNGDIYASQIHLNKNDNISSWHDTNDEPPAPPDPSEEATAEDYQSALNRLGVDT